MEKEAELLESQRSGSRLEKHGREMRELHIYLFWKE